MYFYSCKLNSFLRSKNGFFIAVRKRERDREKKEALCYCSGWIAESKQKEEKWKF